MLYKSQNQNFFHSISYIYRNSSEKVMIEKAIVDEKPKQALEDLATHKIIQMEKETLQTPIAQSTPEDRDLRESMKQARQEGEYLRQMEDLLQKIPSYENINKFPTFVSLNLLLYLHIEEEINALQNQIAPFRSTEENYLNYYKYLVEIQKQLQDFINKLLEAPTLDVNLQANSSFLDEEIPFNEISFPPNILAYGKDKQIYLLAKSRSHEYIIQIPANPNLPLSVHRTSIALISNNSNGQAFWRGGELPGEQIAAANQRKKIEILSNLSWSKAELETDRTIDPDVTNDNLPNNWREFIKLLRARRQH